MTDPLTHKRVCLGAFAGAYGVKGEARVKSFAAAPADVASYGPLTSEDGARVFTLQRLKPLKADIFAAQIPEIKTREEAEALKGTRLYVDRAVLPPPAEDEFYYEDLVGLAAESVDGAPLGRVRAVFDHGAGDLLELVDIPGVKGARLAPFTKDGAPIVDIAGGRIVLNPPEGLFDVPDRSAAGQGEPDAG
ncbi:MAG: ribosome maturation factor RimM [Pseudomonadota bacterium]